MGFGRPAAIPVLLAAITLLSACEDVSNRSASISPTFTSYGPFSFISGCFDPSDIAGPDNPLPIKDPETYDDDPFGADTYMLFPVPERSVWAIDVGTAKYGLDIRDNADGSMSLNFGYQTIGQGLCVHRIGVTGRSVSLTPKQGGALTSARLSETDANVAAWRSAELTACEQRNPRSWDYQALCELSISGFVGPPRVGPEFAVPARIARIGFFVDGIRYAVTFFGDQIAVDRL